MQSGITAHVYVTCYKSCVPCGDEYNPSLRRLHIMRQYTYFAGWHVHVHASYVCFTTIYLTPPSIFDGMHV